MKMKKIKIIEKGVSLAHGGEVDAYLIFDCCDDASLVFLPRSHDDTGPHDCIAIVVKKNGEYHFPNTPLEMSCSTFVNLTDEQSPLVRKMIGYENYES
jgi:hypothetical protein